MSQPHLSEENIKRYLSKTLPPNELLTADDHLAECQSCRKESGNLSSNQQNIEFLKIEVLKKEVAGNHLTYEQINSYVDNEIDDIAREIVETHKIVCTECATELREIQELREILNPAPELVKNEVRPGINGVPVIYRNKWWHQPIFRFGTLAACMILVGTIFYLILNKTELPREIAENLPPPTNSNLSQSQSNHDMPTAVQELSNESLTVNLSPVVSENLNGRSPEPQIRESFNDGGGKIVLDEKGNLTGLNDLSLEQEQKIKNALTTQNLNVDFEGRALKSRTGILMGKPETGVTFALSNPVGEIVQSDRPRFRWLALKEAESYVVSIFDANFNKIASSQATPKTEWTPDVPLKRGLIYQWQVTAIKDGQEIKSSSIPAPAAKFKILDAAKLNEIEQAKKKNGNSNLLLGILYADAGLLNEAEREFQILLKRNPKSVLARKLLQKVRSDR